MAALLYADLSEKIIAAAYNVHNELGHGFIEKVYKYALTVELKNVGVRCNLEVPLQIAYRSEIVGEYVADIVVDGKIIVEAKAVSKLNPAHEVQLVNYLKATGLHVGLLINFGQSVQIKRRVFGYQPGDRKS